MPAKATQARVYAGARVRRGREAEHMICATHGRIANARKLTGRIA